MRTSRWNQARAVVSAMRALNDADLVRAMRKDEPAAWREFYARFRPVLEEYAVRTRIPESEWDVCIGEVLNEEAIRLTGRSAVASRITGYLVKAVRHRWLRVRRDHATRQRLYRQAANDPDARRPVVRAVVSEATRRASEDPSADAAETGASPALRHMAALVRRGLTAEESQLLDWAGDLIPRPLIADWLGVGYHAARKKVTRAIERARAQVRVCEQELSPREIAEWHRLLKRAGVLPSDDEGPESGRRDAGEG